MTVLEREKRARNEQVASEVTSHVFLLDIAGGSLIGLLHWFGCVAQVYRCTERTAQIERLCINRFCVSLPQST